MILFIALLAFNVWGVLIILDEEDKINTCYYDICSESIDAVYDDNICICYDYDMMGNLITTKTEYMK